MKMFIQWNDQTCETILLMRSIYTLTFCVLFGIQVTALRADREELPGDVTESQAPPTPLYDANEKHLWNRLHNALFVRKDGTGEFVGGDELDPLLWHDSRYLLEEPGYSRAVELLTEFNASGFELIRDPLKRAVLQHDLWFVFDWVSRGREPHHRQLRRQLALAMRRIALTSDEVTNLPDTYELSVKKGGIPKEFDHEDTEKSFLPANLFDENGPWVCVNRSGPDHIAARLHVRIFGARSSFLIFIRLPEEERSATTQYLKSLSLFKRPVVVDKNPIGHRFSGGERIPVRSDVIHPNPDLPQFPAGTQVALVRMMLVVNKDAQPVVTRIVEKVQTRVYLTVNKEKVETWSEAPMQAFHEVRINRGQLFKGQGGLKGIKLDEPRYHHFFAHGERVQFQRGPHKTGCMGCHRGNGVHSLNSYVFGHGFEEDLAPRLSPVDWRHEANVARNLKLDRYDWGILRGLWETQQ